MKAIPTPPSRPLQILAWLSQPALRLAWVVVLATLVASIAFWRLAQTNLEVQTRSEFESLAGRVVGRLQETMASYEQVLRGGVALFQTMPGLTREEFRQYISGLNIDQLFPSLQGVGYAVFVPAAEREPHEAAIRASGRPGYRIQPDGDRPLYSSIIFLEPEDWRNKRAIGFDMYSEPTRREAMDRAIELDKPALSGRVTLVQETAEDVQAGFLLYLPHYRKGAPVGTAAERREAILGFVYSPFRAANLMRSVFEAKSSDVRRAVRFAVFDGPEIEPQKLLFSTEANPDEIGRSAYRLVRRETIGNRTWTFQFGSTPEFESRLYDHQPVLDAAVGFLAGALLAVFIAARSLRQEQLTRSNAHMSLLTRELSHRVKNTLAVVQSIAARSMSGNRSLPEVRDIFMKRLHALARAHSLLLDTSWQGASLKQLVSQELEAFGERAVIDGPDIELSSSSAQMFALVVHELATNALKHGAFSTEGGRVAVRWRIVRRKEGNTFMFDWREIDGPPVSEPTHRGFGRILLAQPLGIGGEPPQVHYDPSGLRYRVEIPLASVAAGGADNESDSDEQIITEDS